MSGDHVAEWSEWRVMNDAEAGNGAVESAIVRGMLAQRDRIARDMRPVYSEHDLSRGADPVCACQRNANLSTKSTQGLCP